MKYLFECTTDIGEPLKRTIVPGELVQFNRNANMFQITVLDNGEPVALTSIQAYFVRPDNTTVNLDENYCTTANNIARVNLSDQCYGVVGPAILTVNDVSSDSVTCIGIFECRLSLASSDSVVDTDEIIPSVQSLITLIEDTSASIPEDYTEMAGDVAAMKQRLGNLPVEPGSEPGSMQIIEYATGGIPFTQRALEAGSHAEGANTVAGGLGSHVEGYDGVAWGSYSHVEGLGERYIPVTVTTQGNSQSLSLTYAESNPGDTVTSNLVGSYLVFMPGVVSHNKSCQKITSINPLSKLLSVETSLGVVVHDLDAVIVTHIATGNGSHVEGASNVARGAGSHAEGGSTLAKSPRSHVEGYRTIAGSPDQHVEGKYNIEDTAHAYLHIAGNGTSDSARSNAYTLDWEGNAWFAGSISLQNGDTVVTLSATKLAQILADYPD